MNKKMQILSILLIIIISIIIIPKEFQNDTFYLIKVGESITKNGIDFIDHFSFHNLPYLYPHFIFSVIVYIFYNLLSFVGLHILTIIFTIILGVCIYFVNIKNSKNNIISLGTTILFLLLILGFLTLRAQILSYSIFILEYYFINKLIQTNKNKYIVYIFLIAVLLVNTHVAVYPFFIILFLPFIGEYILNKILKKENFKIKKILISLLLALLAGLASPLFLNSYTYLYNTLINNTTNYIDEHQPTELYKDLRMIAMILITIYLFVSKKIKLEIKEKLLLLGLIYMALSSIRHQSLLSIFLFIIINKHFSLYFSKERINELENIITKPLGIGFAVVILLILSIPITIKNINSDYIDKEKYPVEAVEYIKENLDYENIRIFNTYDIGSYLILNDIKVFIDSRSDLYTYSYNKTRDIYDDYINIVDFRAYYENLFTMYNIDYILMPSNNKLLVYLSYGNDKSLYAQEYKDESFTLLKRVVLK